MGIAHSGAPRETSRWRERDAANGMSIEVRHNFDNDFALGACFQYVIERGDVSGKKDVNDTAPDGFHCSYVCAC